MPTIIHPKTLVPASRAQANAAPFIIVMLLSLLFAGAIWAAGASKPLIDPATAAMQGGL